jgi:hypothetical protein
VKGRETSEETITVCREVGRRMGMDVSILSNEQAASANAASRVSPAQETAENNPLPRTRIKTT